ncbi:MAG: ABC transporter permease, partial [Patescibacteria group bacterium]
RIAPMTYAVDFLRTVFYQGRPDYAAATIFTPLLNIIVMGSMFALFIIIGTYFFVKNERNR